MDLTSSLETLVSLLRERSHLDERINGVLKELHASGVSIALPPGAFAPGPVAAEPGGSPAAVAPAASVPAPSLKGGAKPSARRPGGGRRDREYAFPKIGGGAASGPARRQGVPFKKEEAPYGYMQRGGKRIARRQPGRKRQDERVNPRYLREEVARVLREHGGPMHADALYDALEQAGYRFTANEPRKSFATRLYNFRELVRVGPLTFDLAERAPGAEPADPAAVTAGAGAEADDGPAFG